MGRSPIQQSGMTCKNARKKYKRSSELNGGGKSFRTDRTVNLLWREWFSIRRKCPQTGGTKSEETNTKEEKSTKKDYKREKDWQILFARPRSLLGKKNMRESGAKQSSKRKQEASSGEREELYPVSLKKDSASRPRADGANTGNKTEA